MLTVLKIGLFSENNAHSGRQTTSQTFCQKQHPCDVIVWRNILADTFDLILSKPLISFEDKDSAHSERQEECSQIISSVIGFVGGWIGTDGMYGKSKKKTRWRI